MTYVGRCWQSRYGFLIICNEKYDWHCLSVIAFQQIAYNIVSILVNLDDMMIIDLERPLFASAVQQENGNVRASLYRPPLTANSLN